jgi:beta-glucosidase
MNLTALQFPGVNHQGNYTERLGVGYRWYHLHKVTPAYPFGHGLSYSRFSYGNLSLSLVPGTHDGKKNNNNNNNNQNNNNNNDNDKYAVVGSTIRASFSVRNEGAFSPAAEVPQLYLTFPDSAGEPPRQLKGFEKIMFEQQGESKRVTMDVTAQMRSVWDTPAHDWAPTTGVFKIEIGGSSEDVRLMKTIEVTSS